MIRRNKYEELLLEEIEELSDTELRKVVKTVYFSREEILKKTWKYHGSPQPCRQESKKVNINESLRCLEN